MSPSERMYIVILVIAIVNIRILTFMERWYHVVIADIFNFNFRGIQLFFG